MVVEKKVLSKWKMKRETGDQRKIAEQYGISENAISRAFSGRASEKTIQAIETFYNNK